jgi:RCC1-like G exchanging factor-like protein
MSVKKVTQIAAGWNHSLVLTENGDMYACGYGAHGQLGLGEKESKTQFTLVS